jgi:hypothetical protein
MVRMKLDDDEFDDKELDVEYEGPQFERYTGEVPKTGTILVGRVTKAWWRLNEDNDNQMPLIVVAEQNTGKLKEFNGLPIWEYITWTPKNSRRYQPFLQLFGLTTADVKRKMDVEPDDDNIGTPINSIADWEVGSDDALCRVVIKRDFWNDDWRAKIDWDGWLPFDIDTDADADADDDEDDEEEQRRPARTRKAKPASKPAATRSRTRRPEPEDDDDVDVDEDEDVDDYDVDEEDDEEEAEPATRRAASRPARSTARPARSAAGATGRSAGRSSARTAARPAARTASKAKGRSRAAAADDDEPPF